MKQSLIVARYNLPDSRIVDRIILLLEMTLHLDRAIISSWSNALNSTWPRTIDSSRPPDAELYKDHFEIVVRTFTICFLVKRSMQPYKILRYVIRMFDSYKKLNSESKLLTSIR